jgi:hypothetical protein
LTARIDGLFDSGMGRTPGATAAGTRPEGYLVVEALVAARRDAALAGSVTPYVRERADRLAGLVREAQAAGELDPALSPRAAAHFCLALALGSALVPPELHDVDEEEWAALLGRLMTALSPAPALQTGAAR